VKLRNNSSSKKEERLRLILKFHTRDWLK